MPNDQDIPSDRPEISSTDRPTPAYRGAGGLGMAMLALLTAGTSWAVASWVSVWLVPPYLILMALLLLPSMGRPQGEPAVEAEEPSDSPGRARPGGKSDDPDLDPDASASAGASGDGSGADPSTDPPKGRRGKGRARKAKPLPELREATWVQVGPGKFVRVEVSESSDPAGPHTLDEGEAVPVEVSSTPSESEPPEDPADRAEPLGEVESQSFRAPGDDGGAEPFGNVDGPSTADGIAPQVDLPVVGPESAGPEASLHGAPVDESEAEPEAEWSAVEGDPLPSADDSRPMGNPVLGDVSVVEEEKEEDREATPGEADPTETPVDETDFDDAGPPEDLAPPIADLPPAVDADDPEGDALPSLPPKGSPSWPWRLSARTRTRVGTTPRATDRREASRRRPERPVGPSRRTTGPRRPARRAAGRPRQITRTLPPRSPPGRQVGRG